MLDTLLELVKEQSWEDAGELAQQLMQKGEESEIFYILNATISKNLWGEEKEYDSITQALTKYPLSYELYFMLGNYYQSSQKNNQAYLCYEQALHYCGNQADQQTIQDSMVIASRSAEFSVNPVSVVILSMTNSQMLQGCLQSISRNMTGQYEILVVDNLCMGQELQWVNDYEGAKLISCNDSMGFAQGVNTGVKLAGIDNDIYLFSSDAILLPNAFFWLRMALYERDTVGAAGGISNRAFSQQTLELPCKTIEEYSMAAEVLNTPDIHAHENKLWLDTFSLLIKREALDYIGLFEGKDIRHWYSCIDYGMRLIRADYESILCYNSYVYRHTIVDSYDRQDELVFTEDDMEELEKKSKCNILYYSDIRSEIIQKIHHSDDEEIWVLEIGCGCGSTLSAIQSRYPNAHVYGVELIEAAAAYGKYMADITVGDIETMKLPYKKHMFDYVIFGDVLEHLRRPENVISRLKEYLRPDGRILASIPNVMNIEVVVSLLKGNFTYQSKGLMDRTHIHMFTLREIKRMFQNAGYVIEDIQWMYNREGLLDDSIENEKIIEAVYQMEGIADKQEFEVYQYLIEAVIDTENYVHVS